MILFEFYLVLENVFALSACKFNEQKRPAKVFGDRNKGAFFGSKLPVFADLILLVKFNFSPGCISTSLSFT